ncbi:MAG TPA: hypothetical protein VGM07_16385 [Stellaceae bacterium]
MTVLRADGFSTSTLAGGPTTKVPAEIDWTAEAYDKGDFAHRVLKEIAEQPDAVQRTLSGRLEERFHATHLGGIELTARELLEVRRAKILGCGSAFISGTLGAHLVESWRGCRPRPSPPPNSATQSGHRAGHALYRGQPVGRDLRHPRRGAGGAEDIRYLHGAPRKAPREHWIAQVKLSSSTRQVLR